MLGNRVWFLAWNLEKKFSKGEKGVKLFILFSFSLEGVESLLSTKVSAEVRCALWAKHVKLKQEKWKLHVRNILNLNLFKIMYINIIGVTPVKFRVWKHMKA